MEGGVGLGRDSRGGQIDVKLNFSLYADLLCQFYLSTATNTTSSIQLTIERYHYGAAPAYICD